MLRCLPLPSLAVMGMLGTGMAHGQSSTLYADGLVRVQGADWRESRVTVIPEFGEAFEIPLTSNHFKLDLGLESSYLVRAAHKDCAAKEVVFDLHVPAAYRGQDFQFPFEIVLEAFKAKEERYAYAKPVGAVYFDPAKEDFTYTTEYARIEKARAVSSLSNRMDEHITLHPVQADLLADYAALFANDPNAAPLDTGARNSGQPMAPPAVTGAYDTVTAEPLTPIPVRNVGMAVPAAPRPIGSSAAPAPTPRPLPVAASSRAPAPGEAVPVPDIPRPESRISTQFTMPQPDDAHAMREFNQLPTMLIQIDRFGYADTTVELRKVTHAYGAVFYFKDGYSITERAYLEEIARNGYHGQRAR